MKSETVLTTRDERVFLVILERLHLACFGVFASHRDTVNLHQKQVLVPVLKGWMPGCIRCGVTAVLLVPRSQGRGLESDGAGGKLSSYILWWAISWMRFSIAVLVCECVCSVHISHCVSLLMSLCVCLCVAANRILAQSCPSQLDKGNRWVSLKSAHSLDSPASALHPHPPLPPSLQPLHPPRPAVHGFCNFIKAPDHSFTVKSTVEMHGLKSKQYATTIKIELIIWVI